MPHLVLQVLIISENIKRSLLPFDRSKCYILYNWLTNLKTFGKINVRITEKLLSINSPHRAEIGFAVDVCSTPTSSRLFPLVSSVTKATKMTPNKLLMPKMIMHPWRSTMSKSIGNSFVQMNVMIWAQTQTSTWPGVRIWKNKKVSFQKGFLLMILYHSFGSFHWPFLVNIQFRKQMQVRRFQQMKSELQTINLLLAPIQTTLHYNHWCRRSNTVTLKTNQKPIQLMIQHSKAFDQVCQLNKLWS